jgi:UDP-glucose 4-epimerase
MANQNRPRKVLITGGAGFVGSHLIRALAAEGRRRIVVVDNESLGHPGHIADLDIEYVLGDIADEPLMRRLLEGAHEVIHLAADTRVMDSIADPAHNFATNVAGTFGLLLAARDAGVERFVNASTGGAILGERTPPIDEEMAAMPLSPYGAAKLAVEGYCSAFQGAYGLATVSLRFSNIYGPLSRHKGSVVAHFFRAILNGEPVTIYGDGTQKRDFLFVGDLVRGIVQALDSRETGVFQLGFGEPTTINELVEAIRAVVGPDRRLEVAHADFRAGEVRDTWCNIGKARAALGFAPSTQLAEGLAKTWKWFTN